MNKLTLAALTLGTAIGLSTAANASIVLTFEGLGDQAPIGSYYDGGGGGNYGITFGANSLSIISVDAGGSGNFNGNPSGKTVAFFLSGAGDVMDKPTGFTTGFSFYYSAIVYPGTVTVWSGLDGTGSLLASVNLPVTPSGGGSCDTSYCPWFPAGVAFSGTAESAVFSGTANYIGFDNITLGSATPGAPEASTWAMMMLGFAGLGFAGYRASRKTAAFAA